MEIYKIDLYKIKTHCLTRHLQNKLSVPLYKWGPQCNYSQWFSERH